MQGSHYSAGSYYRVDSTHACMHFIVFTIIIIAACTDQLHVVMSRGEATHGIVCLCMMCGHVQCMPVIQNCN